MIQVRTQERMQLFCNKFSLMRLYTFTPNNSITSFNSSTPSRRKIKYSVCGRGQNQNCTNSNILRVHFVKIEEMKRQVIPCESSFKEVSFKWQGSQQIFKQEVITDKVGGSSAKPEVSKQSKEKRLKHKVSGYKSQSKRRSIAGCRLLLRTLKWSNSTIGFTDPEVIIPITTMDDKNPWNGYGKPSLPDP